MGQIGARRLTTPSSRRCFAAGLDSGVGKWPPGQAQSAPPG
jgi:hypothetical protein